MAREDLVSAPAALGEQLAAIIEELPPRQRKVLIMRRVLGRKRSEIAAELGIGIKAVDLALVALHLV